MKRQTPTNRSIRVLEAASKLIAHYGFDKTTMEDIAHEAGVSKGALYLIWSSKDDLFDALLACEMRRLLLDLSQRIEQDPHGGRIANQYRHTLLALQANPLVSSLYTRDSRILGDFIHRQDPSRYTDRLAFGAPYLKQLQSAGLLKRDFSPEVLAYLFTVIALGFIHIGSLIPASSAPPIDEVGRALSSMVEEGLVASDGESTAGKQTIGKMIDYLLGQYEDQLKIER